MANSGAQFEDMLPVMAHKLGGEGLIEELCHGFDILEDRERALITFDNLKRNSALLGLEHMRDDELRSMVTEGDVDQDGMLNQMELCVLMFRLSPDLMAASEAWLETTLQEEMSANKK